MPLAHDDLWFACTEPESPPDPMVLWHYREDGVICVPCAIKVEAEQKRRPDDPHLDWLAGMVGHPLGDVFA